MDPNGVYINVIAPGQFGYDLSNNFFFQIRGTVFFLFEHNILIEFFFSSRIQYILSILFIFF